MLQVNKKGQMSLEMVIGLIILLVVAGVVISLLLHYLSPERMPSTQEQMAIRDFKQNCEKYCKDTSTLNYCRYYFEGNDWDGNGMKNEIVEIGDQKWKTCEDRIYCFFAVPCDRFGNSATEIMKRCSHLLCQNYLDKYEGNVTLANNATLKEIKGSGDTLKCNLSIIGDTENWHKKFFGEHVCGTS